MSGYIFKQNSTLDHEDIQTGSKGKGSILSKLYGKINAMYEHLTGTPAPGSGSRSMVGHDHTAFGGGAILPRGMALCMDHGSNYPLLPNAMGLGFSSVSSWTNENLVAYSPALKTYITEGINSDTLNNLGMPCTLEGKMLLFCDNPAGLAGNAVFSVQIVNRETNTACLTISKTIAAGSSSLTWENVLFLPLGSGGWQEYDILTSCTHPGNNCTINICSLVLVESYENTQPASAGTVTANLATIRP